MKYDIDVKKVRGIQKAIWDNIIKTFEYRKGYGKPLPIYGHYGGVFKAGDENLVIHTDGVGTKLLLAEKMKKYDTVGIDAIAMSVNDILCLGAESLVGVDYIALREENPEMINDIVKGLVEGAKQCDCVIIGGETAIVKDLLKEDAFDVTFTVVGRIKTKNKKAIIGDKIKPGMVLLGLESSGIHSNGYTLTRKALDLDKWGKELLEPTKIYVKPVLEVMNSLEIYGIAHITGGAFSKLTRLNKDVEFEIEKNKMPELSPLYNALSEAVGNTLVMHRTFNMGIGMVLVLDKKDLEKAQEILNKHKLKSYVIGETKKGEGVYLKDGNEKIKLSY